MIELIEQSTQSLIVVVAVVTALGVRGMKSTEVVQTKYLPIASMVLGSFVSGGYDAIKSILTGKDDK